MRERIKHLYISFAGLLAIGLVLALIGPFGTYEQLATPARLGYWLLVATLNGVLVDLVIRQVDAQLPEQTPMRRIAAPFLGALFAAVPATAIVAVANGFFGLGWPERLLLLYSQVLFLLVVISTLVYTLQDLHEMALARQPQQKDSPPEPAQPTPNPWTRFKERLPDPMEGDLLCLEMHDHYLAVHTTAGKQLILCRMEDAARELEDLGQRVHRSWWVAASAVTGTEKQGQRLFLRLIDGKQVPVGRTYKDGLKQTGWFQP